MGRCEKVTGREGNFCARVCVSSGGAGGIWRARVRTFDHCWVMGGCLLGKVHLWPCPSWTGRVRLGTDASEAKITQGSVTWKQH